MTITYEEALSTLSSMFTTYTSSQLDAVLRHHNGHMEHTVETLLGHTGSPEELIEKIRRGEVSGSGSSGGGNGAAAHNIDADEELARQLAREDQRPVRGSAFVPPGQRRMMASNIMAPSRAAAPAPQPPVRPEQKGRGTPTTLPVDFLRIPGRKYPQQQSTTPTNAGGMTDEQLARMLQDELFQEELRNNPEFSHLAGRRQQQMTGRSTYAGAGESSGVNWEEIGNRLTAMGDTAKRRFQEFAANWSDPSRRYQYPQQHQPNAAAAAGTNERRGLLSNNDLDMEEEMDFVGGSGRGDAVELRDVSSGGVDWSGDKKKD